MQTLTMPLLLVAVVVGGVAAAGVCAFMLSDGDPDAAADSNRSALPDRSEETIARLDTLSQQMREVSDRVATLEARTQEVSTSSFSQKKSEERMVELSGRLEALEQRPQPGAVADPSVAAPVISAKVESALKSIRKRETANKWRVGTEKRHANLDRRLARMQSSLDLNPGQVDSLRQVHEEQHRRTLETIRLWEEDLESEANLGGLKRTNYQTYQEALAGILTPAQLQLHQQQQASGGKD